MIKATSIRGLVYYLCKKLKDDENNIVEFGLHCSDKGKPSISNVGPWYYIQLCKNEHYTSQHLIVDYCGGGEAMAISVPWKYDFSQDDISNILGYLINYITLRKSTEVYIDMGIVWDDYNEGDEFEIDGKTIRKIKPVMCNAMNPETGEMLHVNEETMKIEEVKR